MDINSIALHVKQMKGLMPEPNRTLIAHKFMNLIGSNLKGAGGENWDIWCNGGCVGWLGSCYLTGPLPKVEETFDLSVSELAGFCNRWAGAETYKPSTDPDGDYQPFTANMNFVRQTMLMELIKIYEEKGGPVEELDLQRDDGGDDASGDAE